MMQRPEYRKPSGAAHALALLATSLILHPAGAVEVISDGSDTTIIVSARVGSDGEVLHQSGRWIETVAHSAIGQYVLELRGALFLDPPVCTVSAETSPAIPYLKFAPDGRLIVIETVDAATKAPVESTFHVLCMGSSFLTLDGR